MIYILLFVFVGKYNWIVEMFAAIKFKIYLLPVMTEMNKVYENNNTTVYRYRSWFVTIR
jgi:hypothetical protein